MNDSKLPRAWKRVFVKEAGKRRLAYHETVNVRQNLTFHVVPVGGFCTVKRYWLTVYDGLTIRETLLACHFDTLKAAKAWVDAFLFEGAVVSPFMLKPLYR